MKKSELKEIIKSAFLAEVDDLQEKYDDVQEAENVDVTDEENVDVTDEENVDVDVEKDVEVDDKSTEADIEVKASVSGESEDVEAVQGLLTKAQSEAEKLGDEKLLAQIGNTITYFTRKHVVAVDENQDGDPERFVGSGGDEVDSDSNINVTKDNPAQDAEIGYALNEEVQRFKKLAGLIK